MWVLVTGHKGFIASAMVPPPLRDGIDGMDTASPHLSAKSGGAAAPVSSSRR